MRSRENVFPLFSDFVSCDVYHSCFSCLFFVDLPSSVDIERSHHTKQKNCQETIEIQPGCEIVDRKCECWNQPIVVCKENLVRWDFTNSEVWCSHSSLKWLNQNGIKSLKPQCVVECGWREKLIRISFSLQECELNLANLYKFEVEFDEDYTIPPKKFGKNE